MPYPADDYLDSVVRPLYAFLQREVQGRASSPIVDRVMYDDVNEFFWLRERFKVVLPPRTGTRARPRDDRGGVGLGGRPRGYARHPRRRAIYARTSARVAAAAAAPDEGPAAYLSGTFFKTHREVATWMSMFVNFNAVFLFHAVAFHVSMAYVFAHGWNWTYVSAATITHSVIKLAAELATLHFRNLSKESGRDWAVTMTRVGAFAMIPMFYLLERDPGREDGQTPTSRRSPSCTRWPSPASARAACAAADMGSSAQLATTPFRSASSTRCSGSWCSP